MKGRKFSFSYVAYFVYIGKRMLPMTLSEKLSEFLDPTFKYEGRPAPTISDSSRWP